jgi:DNA-binding MarR family transcriptional regulator
MGLSAKTYLQINQALFSLAHAYESRLAKEEARNAMGLKMSDGSVLMLLHQFAPITASRLSKIMDVNPGAVSIYVHHLVEMGLVAKRQDPDDRRNWHLTLTDAGATVARGVVDGAVEYTRDFLSDLGEGEQRDLHRLLLKASHALGFTWQ